MGIMLGNLTIKQIQARLEIELTAEEVTRLDEMRQEDAQNIAADKWHCFDMPFMIACGSMETAQKVYDVLKPYGGKMKGQVQIGVA